MLERAKSEAEVREAVRGAILPGDRVVLAVSGGRDSMVLLDAVARWRRGAIAAVATYDHGTGAAARAAADLVRLSAHALDLPLIHGWGRDLARTEAAWRAARWEFLRDAAASLTARVATAHSRDDQVETVFMRMLRDSGPRGLAGLYAETDIVRPLLHVARSAIAAYAEARRVPVVEDPSNHSRRHLRNRVRLDLLPAFERVHPGFSEELLGLARRSSQWRAQVEALAAACAPRADGASVFVEAEVIERYSEEALGFLWPALAARAGIALDRRGTQRLAAFTRRGQVGGSIPLSGGHEVRRHRGSFEIRPALSSPPEVLL
jgi:tRNA(Ile)-lysidine synthase